MSIALFGEKEKKSNPIYSKTHSEETIALRSKAFTAPSPKGEHLEKKFLFIYS